MGNTDFSVINWPNRRFDESHTIIEYTRLSPRDLTFLEERGVRIVRDRVSYVDANEIARLLNGQPV